MDETFKRAGTALGAQGVLHRLIAPLTQVLGDLWRVGKITAAHEHFATGRIRAFLANLAKPFGGGGGGPALVVATPAGQLHEMGAMLVGALAANLGWKVSGLGASLPAAEIAGAARQKQARAVALSLVYPEDDANLPGELALLRESLSEDTALLVGGRAMPAYRGVLRRLGAILPGRPGATWPGVGPVAPARTKGRTMREFPLQTEIWLSRPRDEVFAFFAEARNLEALTPPWLHAV